MNGTNVSSLCEATDPSLGGTAGLPLGFDQKVNDALLTPTEREVCKLVICGLSNKEIACVRCRSPATIKNQVASILDKFGVPNRCHLLVRLR